MLAGCGVDLLRVEQKRPANDSSFWQSARARSVSPITASADTSQNEQMVNVPSSPENPVSVPSTRSGRTRSSLVSSSAMARTVAHALVAGRQEPHEQKQQQRGVQIAGLVMLAEHAPV